MNRIQVAFLFVCLTAILVVSVACGGISTAPTAATSGPTKWEYKLDAIQFDTECATQALSPHQALEEIREVTDGFGYSSYAIGWIWQTKNCFDRDYPAGVFEKIMSDYIACGQQAFDSYAAKLGDASWEMVSYSRMQHTTSGTQYCSAILTDYGYEAMWKRPKTAN